VRNSHDARFAAKLTKSAVRKTEDKTYWDLRLRIPNGVARRLKLEPGDYVSVAMRKALWFDLLNWEEMPLTWSMLPESLKKRITERQAISLP
jgi:hypothetical protein